MNPSADSGKNQPQDGKISPKKSDANTATKIRVLNPVHVHVQFILFLHVHRSHGFWSDSSKHTGTALLLLPLLVFFTSCEILED